MTQPPADLGAGIAALTDDQRQGLAHLLYGAHWIDTFSHSTRLAGAELEAMLLRGYGKTIAQAACRLAELPTGPDESGRQLVLAHFELEQHGKFWSARTKLWGERLEVHVLDQPGREFALALALVQLARSVLFEGGGTAVEAFESALGKACDDLEDALYPDPPLEQKIATMRERAMAAAPVESEPSFHGSGGVD